MDCGRAKGHKSIMAEKSKYHHGDLKNALIKAGIEILNTEGIHALTLRKVAQKAGVSHAAPYAHFTDKQALIAAISTEGFRLIYEALSTAITPHTGDPARQLVEGACAYAQFAVSDPAHFKITFSGVIEKEEDYPAFVEISHRTFGRVVDVVGACQQAGVLKESPVDLAALAVWGQVHGVVSLILEKQIPRAILERITMRQIIIETLEQITLVKLPVTP